MFIVGGYLSICIQRDYLSVYSDGWVPEHVYKERLPEHVVPFSGAGWPAVAGGVHTRLSIIQILKLLSSKMDPAEIRFIW